MKSTIRPDIPGVRDGDQWGGQVLFYVCAGCNRPRRYLYPWEMIDGRLVHNLNPRCVQCAGLRYLTTFVEELKASRRVADALQRTSIAASH